MLEAEELPTKPLRTVPQLERLEALADLWGRAYLFHPAIITGGVDWHQALVRAIPRVEAAKTPEELAGALNDELLRLLGDLLTFAEARRGRGIEGSRDGVADREFQARRLTDSVGYVRVPHPTLRGQGFLTEFQETVESLGNIDRLVVDLRWHSPSGLRTADPVLRFFVRCAFTTGPVMNRVHEGWSEDNGPGAYRQKWEVISGTTLHPIQTPDWYLATMHPGADFTRLKTITTPTVFLVNRPSATYQHKVLDALQSQTGIAVVFEPSGPAEEALRPGNGDWGLGTGEAVEVQLNTERLVAHDGSAGFHPDLVVEKEIGPTQLADVAAQALVQASSPKPQASGRESAVKLMDLRLPAPLSEARERLTREERLLGLFKVWSVIRYVYPHLDLCDMDWETCLSEWIPRAEAADTTVAYVRTLRMLTAHLHDNNIFYFFPDLPEPRALPVGFGWVEGKVIVSDLVLGTGGQGPGTRDKEAPPAVGLEVGDELVEFDGKTVPELIAEHRLQFSYSTEGAFYRHMVEMLGFGAAGAAVKLVFRRRERPVSVTLKRTVTREQWVAYLAGKRRSPGYGLLHGNIGYLDLGRLSTLQEFERAFEALHRADGLAIDIRGYPGFMVQLALSARLSRQPVKSAIFEIPVVSGYARLEQGWRTGQYEVQPDPGKYYKGPVVVLINEKTFGGSEDVCIYLKNAGRVTFVGGTSAGCNGNRTWLSLPGGGRLWFTGMRVKFGDGSRFQNVGIVPDVPVAPTADAIRAGRDEVLEKGIEVLRRLVDSPLSSEPAQTRDEGQDDPGRTTL